MVAALLSAKVEMSGRCCPSVNTELSAAGEGGLRASEGTTVSVD